jgi:hypothetical protein
VRLGAEKEELRGKYGNLSLDSKMKGDEYICELQNEIRTIEYEKELLIQ